MGSTESHNQTTAAATDRPAEEPADQPGTPTRPSADRSLAPRSLAHRNNLIVMALLGLDVLMGAAIAATGFYALESMGIALLGAGMATLGLVLMLVFQLVGREK